MKTKGTNFGTKISIYLLFCGLIVFWSFQVFGQEWTAEQKEIWKVVEADYELFKQGDLEGILASRHDDVVLWWSNKSIPLDKELLKLNYKRWLDYDKPVKWELEPLAIQVIGNVGNVFYTYKYSGKILSDSGRAMITWIKQDNKWQMIGGLTASCNKLPPCK